MSTTHRARKPGWERLRHGGLLLDATRLAALSQYVPVEPFDGETGRLHLVHLEYKDDRVPSEERILWEIEPDRYLLEPNALPTPAHDGDALPAEDFDAQRYPPLL